MAEAQAGGVEGLAAKAGQGLPAGRAETGPALGRLLAIDRVAQQGMADGGQMDPDLVGPARGQPAFHQARPQPQGGHHPVAGEGRPPAAG